MTALMCASARGRSAVVGIIKASKIMPAIVALARSSTVLHPVTKLILIQLYGENEFMLSLFYKYLYN